LFVPHRHRLIIRYYDPINRNNSAKLSTEDLREPFNPRLNLTFIVGRLMWDCEPTFRSLIRAEGADAFRIYMLTFSIIIIQVPCSTCTCGGQYIVLITSTILRSDACAVFRSFVAQTFAPLYAAREGYKMSQEGYARPWQCIIPAIFSGERSRKGPFRNTD